MSDQLPSRRKALSLLIQSGCHRGVIKHCKAVANLAVEIAKACKTKGINLNIQLVEVGALLHDIGRSESHQVDHVIIGAKIARAYDLPDAIVHIIERHVGGGITVDEANRLGWPPKSYLPQTIEEKIVSYADKLIEGSRRVPIDRTVKKFSVELGEKHPSIARIRKLHDHFLSLIRDLNDESNLTRKSLR